MRPLYRVPYDTVNPGQHSRNDITAFPLLYSTVFSLPFYFTNFVATASTFTHPSANSDPSTELQRQLLVPTWYLARFEPGTVAAAVGSFNLLATVLLQRHF